MVSRVRSVCPTAETSMTFFFVYKYDIESPIASQVQKYGQKIAYPRRHAEEVTLSVIPSVAMPQKIY